MSGRLCPTCGREMVLQKAPMGDIPNATESEQRMAVNEFKWVCPRDGTSLSVGQE